MHIIHLHGKGGFAAILPACKDIPVKTDLDKNLYFWYRLHMAYDKKYYESNRKKIISKIGKWQKANKHKINAYRNTNTLVQEQRREKDKIRSREYRAKNKDKISIANRKYRISHPEKTKIRDRDKEKKRRALIRHVESENINSDEIYKRDKWVCGLCHQKVNRKLKYPDPKSPSLDHIMPISKGGPHIKSNVQLAHLDCNIIARVGGVKQLLLFG